MGGHVFDTSFFKNSNISCTIVHTFFNYFLPNFIKKKNSEFAALVRMPSVTTALNQVCSPPVVLPKWIGTRFKAISTDILAAHTQANTKEANS